MKALLGLALGAALAVSVSVPMVFLGPSQASGRGCYSIWAQADRMESRYRHTVYVENDCDYWLRCTVWTDVTPQPPKIFSVAPGMTEHAETTGASDVDNPKGFGTCRKE